MFTGDEIRLTRKKQNLTVPELAELIKVKAANLYKWEGGTKPSDPEDYMKIENWLSGKLEIVPPTESKGKAKKPETPENITNDTILQAIMHLSESHQKIIDSNAGAMKTSNDVAETNKTLAESHNMLVKMLKEKSARVVSKDHRKNGQ